MTQSRKLLAIMFTDIAGYTALMGKDEQKAFKILNQNRELQQTLIEQYSGKWIKEIGDGILASFLTVTDAVICASSIQKACTQIPDLQLHIGIHQGEVICEDNDVFGDTVNIASRIQSLAPINCIWISEHVYNNISNKKEIKTKFIRQEFLKNVKDPIRIYEVISDNAIMDLSNFYEAEKNAYKNIPKKSIAVLPFVNMSNDPEQDYFSDGIAEEILTSLSGVKDLKVAGRTSSAQYKGVKIDLRDLGQKLGVSSVLEGSIRKQGNRLRITAQLIDAENGFHLWSEKYDRGMDDIFAIQDEIALSITEKLKVTLLEEEKTIITKIPTNSKEAYNVYLKGRFHWNKRGLGLRDGLKYFLQAIELDNNFALAYAGVADGYALTALYCEIQPNEAMTKAMSAAEKAIKLDPTLVEAYSTRAFVTAFYEWNWPETEKRFQKVFDINFNYAPAHYWFSLYLAWVKDDFDNSTKEMLKATELLEPLVSSSHHLIAMMLITNGQFEEAVKESNMALDLDPNSFPAFRTLGISLASLKRYSESIEALNNAAKISARHHTVLAELCWIYSLTNQSLEADKIYSELIAQSLVRFTSAVVLCCAAYFTKNDDEALKYIESAFENRDPNLLSIKIWPPFTFINKDPRFEMFVKKMNFPTKD